MDPTPEELAAQAAAAAALAADPTPAPTPAPAAELPPVAAPAPAAAPEAPEVDEYAAAFADLNDPKPAAPTPAPAPAAKKPDVPAAAPAAPAPVVPAAEVTPPVVPAVDDVAALRAEIAALKAGQTPAPAAPAASPAPAPAPAPPAAAGPTYSDDEAAFLKKYREDWPDIARADELLRREQYKQVVQYVFDQLNPVLAGLSTTAEDLSSSEQLRALKGLVPDYDAVRDPTLAWIEKQPAYLKTAYEQVTQSGTPTDVADLINRFKKETNWTAPAAAPGGQPPAAAPAAPPIATPAAGGMVPAGGKVAPEVAAAAAALRPVVTRRSDPAAAPDPNDYDSAFKEFASDPAR